MHNITHDLIKDLGTEPQKILSARCITFVSEGVQFLSVSLATATGRKQSNFLYLTRDERQTIRNDLKELTKTRADAIRQDYERYKQSEAS